MAQQQNNPNYNLYSKLREQGLYTKSYEEFQKQFAGHERVAVLFSALKSDGYYTKSSEEFKKQFFSHLPGEDAKQPAVPQKIRIKDDRLIDTATGSPMKDTSRFHAEVDPEYIKTVVATARKHDIDPYTALAINLAETRFADKTNPFMLGNYNPYGDVVDQSMKYMSEKQKYARSLGKKKEEEIIQAWNGYGVIRGKGFMYGIDTNKTPIDMNANPVYGKRVLDLRESVLKRNPEITGLVEQVLSTNPAYEYKLFNQ